MTKTVFVGADPGISGAIAVFFPLDEGFDVVLLDMPVEQDGKRQRVDVKKLNKSIYNLYKSYISDEKQMLGLLSDEYLEIMESIEATYATLEKVGSMPGQGVTSSFNFGDSYGSLRGCLCTFSTVLEVRPGIWKRAMSVTRDKKDTMRLALKYTGATDHIKLVKHDGRAEAVLLGCYGIKQFKGFLPIIKRVGLYEQTKDQSSQGIRW